MNNRVLKMNKLMLVVFLTIFTIEVVNSWTDEDVSCCPPGELLVSSCCTKEIIYCVNPSNRYMEILLKCPPETDMVYIFPAHDESAVFIGSSKQLNVSVNDEFREFKPGSFCIGNRSTDAENASSSILRVATLCLEQKNAIVFYIHEDIYGYCMAISTVFLTITAVIYLAFPKLRDLQGKCIINLCISLGLGLGILAIMTLVPCTNMDLCTAQGFLAYFFVMASFFWMNAISIHILLSTRRPTTITNSKKEFIFYAMYGWGLSAILTIIMAIVNFMPGDHDKPGIGLYHCWFFDKEQQWRYMYSEITTIILINICIFIYTSVILWRQTFSSSNAKALKFKFTMTIRLFVVMGLAWIFAMIARVVKTHIIWEILNLVNTFQGFLIFLVLVVFRRRVVKAMYQNGWLGWISGPVERCLAVGEDDEDVIQHTIGISMDEKGTFRN